MAKGSIWLHVYCTECHKWRLADWKTDRPYQWFCPECNKCIAYEQEEKQ